MASLGAVDPDSPEAVLRAVRERFIESFAGRCASIRFLAPALAAPGQSPALDTVHRLVHQLAGVGATVGFPQVSDRASDFEEQLLLADARGIPEQRMHAALDAIEEAFNIDLAHPGPEWTAPSGASSLDTVLVIEDDGDQRELLCANLRGAGFRAVEAATGEEGLEGARRLKPSIVLLDVDLPGADGFAVCRQLKAHPDLADTPVIFVTTRASVTERLTGLTLGADDYLTKPIDSRELVIRLRLLLKRRSSPPAAAQPLLTYEALSLAAQSLLDREAAGLALVRVPDQSGDLVRTRLLRDLRRRDLAGSYSRDRLVLVMPGLSAATVASSIGDALRALRADGHAGTAAGVAASEAAGARFLALLAAADEGLAAASAQGLTVATKPQTAVSSTGEWPPAGGVSAASAAAPAPGRDNARATIVLADDDPDTLRIVDAQIRAAGYATIVVFDGAAAIARIENDQPDVVVLDLMMPKLTGFDVLTRVRSLTSRRPRILVLSARGREDDVTRAFDLGADDYMIKPFSPPELLARVSRLLR